MSSARFDAAVSRISAAKGDSSAEVTDADKLKLYGLYKQVVEGDVKGTRPMPLYILARAKWDAWNTHKGMSQAAARDAYADAVDYILRRR
jgi:diazepam-binding inhibitor (GABA receptor modulating acyl-CoA-binding protein)